MNLDALLKKSFPETTHSCSARECMLYALAAGLGSDPLDADQLAFVYEGMGPAVLPTMAAVIGMPPFWLDDPALGIDWPAALHGEEAVEIHRPLTADGAITAKVRITDVVDKGPAHGALILVERTLSDPVGGAPVATVRSALIARGDGGFPGGEARHAPALTNPAVATDRDPDTVVDLPTLAQCALLYRLCGDMNPLHADPAVARRAGFERPILHGLCTFAVAGHAVLKEACGYDPKRLKSIAVRFVAPVLPGETIRTEIWRQGEEVAFRALVPERGPGRGPGRGTVVLDRCSARVSAA